MLVFWGNNEALTARKSADYTNLLKRSNLLRRSRYSNRVVSNSNIKVSLSHYYSNIVVTKRQLWYSKQLNEDKAIQGWKISLMVTLLAKISSIILGIIGIFLKA